MYYHIKQGDMLKQSIVLKIGSTTTLRKDSEKKRERETIGILAMISLMVQLEKKHTRHEELPFR
jgi:hypothetical protein